MATYAEITSTKTVNLGADSGNVTLTYYAGNKEKTTGSVVGNVDKKTITHVFDGTSTWINSVTLSNKDTTAKNITVNYQANNSTSTRLVNLKLKDLTSSYYLILKQAGKTETNPSYLLLIACTPNKSGHSFEYVNTLNSAARGAFSSTAYRNVFSSTGCNYVCFTSSYNLIYTESQIVSGDSDEAFDMIDELPSVLVANGIIRSNTKLFVVTTFKKDDLNDDYKTYITSPGYNVIAENNFSDPGNAKYQLILWFK